ncbi:hypothetical protein QF032_003245 [Streptomyces achromogenes]|uniref:hypothetical protein n=1 Tax=Streptomyces achromogenes TaxID=67255 RepID=UPI00277E1E3A|nr:hypothetical protein [Streptomyces achromogenes]MDQ0831401.1 hypothetical protein [Streptomyces achromogenes]
MFSRKAQQPDGTNSGIQNSGSMQNVQNQPGAFNSSQTQDNSGIGRDELQGVAELLVRIRQGMESERARVEDYELCVGFLDTVAEQPLDSPDGRAVAKGLLGKIKEKCGGVPGLASLIASTLSAVSALA